mgnify:CR=1 FL=1
MRQVFSGLLILSLATSAAVAQVAPPPPPQPEERPAVEPPPPPVRSHPVEERPPRPTVTRAPSVDFDPIAVPGPDGRIIRIEEPIEYAALAHNPLIGFTTVARMAPALYERRRNVENLVIEKLDMLDQLEPGGLIDTVRLGGDQLEAAATLTKVMTTIQAINSDGLLVQYLERRGLMGRQAVALNQRIQNDYQSKVIAEIQATPPADGAAEPMDLLTRQALYDSISEVMYWRKRLFLESADNLDVALSGLDLSADVRSRAQPLSAALGAANNIDERLRLVRQVLAMLTPDQRKAALKAVIAARSPVDADHLVIAPGPTDTMAPLTTEVRSELLWSIFEGQPFDITPFIENLPEDAQRRRIR